ncbi:hypothetical protein M3Y95_00046800 [Aphelenchoides besseyi]|nr:hypothetical protein M3Y95_00046800 [Aphelenchoides besseyi]
MADQEEILSTSQKYDASQYLHDRDMLVRDINEVELQKIGDQYGVKHLSATTFPTPPFPVKGYLYGEHSRFMVPLVVRLTKKPQSTPVQVWFLCDSGSPFTCLTVKTLEAFYGSGNIVNTSVVRKPCSSCGTLIGQENKAKLSNYEMKIQDQGVDVACQIARSHYEQVNILGVDAMRDLRLSIDVDWENETFMLIQKKFVI